jgi:Tfp pilus assembly protein PilV
MAATYVTLVFLACIVLSPMSLHRQLLQLSFGAVSRSQKPQKHKHLYGAMQWASHEELSAQDTSERNVVVSQGQML